jgi:hypothetical protein
MNPRNFARKSTQCPSDAGMLVNVRWAATVSCALVLLWEGSALAIDPFEIQVYDGTANDPHVFGLELHTNGVIRGLPQTAPPLPAPELAQDHQLHFTLEPSYGIFSWWEIGGYFQTAIADGSFDYAGVKLRSKFVTPPKWHKYLRLGLNVELSLLPEAFDPDQWAMEFRPMIAWENDHFMFVINPIVDLPLAGPDYAAGPTFEPAATAVYKFPHRVSLGFEYYASFGPFSSFVPIDKQIHYLYEVVNVLAIKNLEVNIGFGEGLTEASNRFVAKMILGYTWER